MLRTEMLTRAPFRPHRTSPEFALKGLRAFERLGAYSRACRGLKRARPNSLMLVLQALVLLVACTSTQCTSTRNVTLLGPGVINDPKNKSLRFDILKFGLKTFCDEMQSQGVALRLSNDHPVAGRFFARACQADIIEDEARRNFTVRFSGVGYVWTNLTGRVGFDMLGAIELLPDFQLAADNSMYVYFRTNRVDITQLKVTLVESSMARNTAALANADPERVGREMVQAQLTRGFTVIRLDESGQMEFGQGLLAIGEHPYHPFKVVSDQPVLVNERTEIHRNQQDFIGPFKVESSGKALAIALSVDGAPGINFAVISGTQGQQLIDRYVHTPGAVNLIEPPRYTRDVPYGSLFQQRVPVPEGSYFLLIQHLAPQAAPQAAAARDDRAAKVDYVVQLVDAP